MKNILFALGILLCYSDAHAKKSFRIGLEAGVQFSNGRYGIPVYIPLVPSYKDIELKKDYYQPRIGERIGGVSAMNLNTRWSLQAGLFLNTKGFKQDSVFSFWHYQQRQAD